jgi:N6-adenosine-specific RNA methylase IME4
MESPNTQPADADSPAQELTDRLTPHARAGLVPAAQPAEYRMLRADIELRGIVTPLEVTLARVVIDGHQRLRIARELALARVPVRVVCPEDEIRYLLLAALRRRHLSASQRAALALELEEYELARQHARASQRANLRNALEVATLPPRGEKTRELAARLAGVSPRTVQDAATVRLHDPTLFEQVKSGDIPAEQAARRVRRALRDAELGAPPPLPEGPFELIYADPPWQLGNADGEKAPEKHYSTMPLADIVALQPPAAVDAILYLWAVNMLLPEALQLIETWDFRYVGNIVWVKPMIGLGHWVRNRHELLLIGQRGAFSPPEPDLRPGSVIEAPRGRHSEKPAVVYKLLERAYPSASKLELFARKARPGWVAWGKEAPR